MSRSARVTVPSEETSAAAFQGTLTSFQATLRPRSGASSSRRFRMTTPPTSALRLRSPSVRARRRIGQMPRVLRPLWLLVSNPLYPLINNHLSGHKLTRTYTITVAEREDVLTRCSMPGPESKWPRRPPFEYQPRIASISVSRLRRPRPRVGRGGSDRPRRRFCYQTTLIGAYEAIFRLQRKEGMQTVVGEEHDTLAAQSA